MISLTLRDIMVRELRRATGFDDLEIFEKLDEPDVEGYNVLGFKRLFSSEHYIVPRYYRPLLLQWDKKSKRMRVDPVLGHIAGKGTQVLLDATMFAAVAALRGDENQYRFIHMMKHRP